MSWCGPEAERDPKIHSSRDPYDTWIIANRWQECPPEPSASPRPPLMIVLAMTIRGPPQDPAVTQTETWPKGPPQRHRCVLSALRHSHRPSTPIL